MSVRPTAPSSLVGSDRLAAVLAMGMKQMRVSPVPVSVKRDRDEDANSPQPLPSILRRRVKEQSDKSRLQNEVLDEVQPARKKPPEMRRRGELFDDDAIARKTSTADCVRISKEILPKGHFAMDYYVRNASNAEKPNYFLEGFLEHAKRESGLDTRYWIIEYMWREDSEDERRTGHFCMVPRLRFSLFERYERLLRFMDAFLKDDNGEYSKAVAYYRNGPLILLYRRFLIAEAVKGLTDDDAAEEAEDAALEKFRDDALEKQAQSSVPILYEDAKALVAEEWWKKYVIETYGPDV